MTRQVTEPATDVGERLFWFRDAAGWTQAETARKAGISRTIVALTETGKTSPRLPTLRRLARAFGVTLEELLDGPIPGRELPEK